jgi:desulfoferrodoxin (superoxide reductase-like protein)
MPPKLVEESNRLSKKFATLFSNSLCQKDPCFFSPAIHHSYLLDSHFMEPQHHTPWVSVYMKIDDSVVAFLQFWCKKRDLPSEKQAKISSQIKVYIPPKFLHTTLISSETEVAKVSKLASSHQFQRTFTCSVIQRQLSNPEQFTDVTPHVSKPHDYVNHMFMRP